MKPGPKRQVVLHKTHLGEIQIIKGHDASRGVDIWIRELDGSQKHLTPRPLVLLRRLPNGDVTIEHQDQNINLSTV